MRTTQLLLATVREVPGDAEVVSHQLMLRAGMVRQLAAGLYTWLPTGMRVLRKVENIVREEMDRSGAQEVLMPAVQPAELWRGITALGRVRPRAAALPRPSRTRLLPGTHPRRGDHRHRPPGDPQLQAAPVQLLPDPNQVP